MPQIRIDITQTLLDELNEKLRIINQDPNKLVTANDIARESLSIYRWILNNKVKGMSIVSTDDDRTTFKSFISPNLPD